MTRSETASTSAISGAPITVESNGLSKRMVTDLCCATVTWRVAAVSTVMPDCACAGPGAHIASAVTAAVTTERKRTDKTPLNMPLSLTNEATPRVRADTPVHEPTQLL